MPAKKITAVRTRRVKGAEEVTHLAEGNRDGGIQWLTTRDVIEAIERGERYFIQVGNESLLLTVQKGADGSKKVGVGIEPGPGRLLTLPRGAG